MSSPDPAKIERYPEGLREEWTGEATVSAWRKWQAPLAAFTREATQALLQAAQLRPGMRVLDLASGVGDPTLAIAEVVGPSGHLIATDLGPGMIVLGEELAQARGLRNIEFRVANVEVLPFPDESFDVVTCRFGAMFFPDQIKAFRECLRVLKHGGRVALVVWGKREEPFLGTTFGIISKYVELPPPDPNAPHAFMFAERGLLTQQFTEIAAPFRSLVAKPTGETHTRAEAEIFEAPLNLYDGSAITMPLEIVVGTGIRA
jgi:SAM-dependent methyltransferase